MSLSCISNFNDDAATINRNGDTVLDGDAEAKIEEVLAALTAANGMLAPLFRLIDDRKLDDVRSALAGPSDQISELVYIVTGSNYEELMDGFGIDVDELEGRFAEIVRLRRFFRAGAA